MEEIITKDGSTTFHNQKYDENYHSVSGAIEEAFEKFVRPCNVKDFKNIRILDICFGIGYNSAAAIEEFLEYNSGRIEITALEKDEGILKEIENLNPKLKYYDIIKKMNRTKDCNNKNIKIKLIMGDAVKTIKEVDGVFDAVFLDPFSPPKNPELWTEEFFRDIGNVMKKGAILATYSCARVVRDNLKKAGFIVNNGPCIGRRAPSTIAVR